MTLALSTRAVRAGIDCDPTHGAVAPPLYLSTNFSFDGFEGKRRYDYTRSGNPTRDQLGQALASLEGGAGGIVTATGLGAIAPGRSSLEPRKATQRRAPRRRRTATIVA
jgi:cystathionine gamma-synthase